MFSSKLFASFGKEYELLLQHERYMEEYEKPFVCGFLALKASFHLKSDMIKDEFPPKEFRPSPNDLSEAEECLNSAQMLLNKMPSRSNFYTARYYRTCCDWHIWKQQYSMAMRYLEKARQVYDHMKFSVIQQLIQQLVDQRFKLLEKLKEGEKINEILKEY